MNTALEHGCPARFAARMAALQWIHSLCFHHFHWSVPLPNILGHPSAQKYALVSGQSGFPTVIPRFRFAASRLRVGCSMIKASQFKRHLYP